MKKTQWIHRTAVRPMYLNVASNKNGLPALLSDQQYLAAQEQRKIHDSDIVLLDHSFWTSDRISPEDVVQLAYIKKLEEAGVTREEYLEAREQNYQQQLQSYFENGLYTQRPLIETTATQLGRNGKNPEAELEKILQKEGFGFATGDSMQGMLSNRDLLNVLLVLEIPEECVSGLGGVPQPLFRESDNPLETFTAYFGPQKLTKVIPAEYIKKAYVVGANDRIEIANPEFNSDFILEDGTYDFNVLKEYVERQMETNYSTETVFALDDLITNYYASSNSYSGYNTLISIVEEKIQTIAESENGTIKDAENYAYIVGVHQVTYEGQRTPLQAIRDKLKHESKTMSPDELENTLLALMKESKRSLQESYKEGAIIDEMPTFRECIELITQDTYKRIYHSHNANDIIGELETKRKIIGKIDQETENYGNHYVDTIIGETIEDRTKAQREMDKSGNISMILQYAVRCEGDIAEAFVRYIKNNDISQLSPEECRDLIPEIRDNAKSARNERTL